MPVEEKEQPRAVRHIQRIIARNVMTDDALAQLRMDYIGKIITFEGVQYRVVSVDRDDLKRAIASCTLKEKQVETTP